MTRWGMAEYTASCSSCLESVRLPLYLGSEEAGARRVREGVGKVRLDIEGSCYPPFGWVVVDDKLLCSECAKGAL